MTESLVPLHCYTIRRFPPVGVGREHPEGDQPDSGDLYEVRIIDNDHNTYGEVIQITMRALDISEEMAFAIAWEVDHMDSCAVAQGPYEDAEAIAQVIRTIGIEVQVNPVAQAT
ncbi:MAG: ATP-dependent Clp protease adaptor ClpS [Desulfomonile tiedjei]|nr:ATP-dependent Clp protease adaptor ClpS [Desulfomonile tiedjei]